MLIRKCDRCGCEMENYVNFKYFTNINMLIGDMTIDADDTEICMYCFNLFKDFLANKPVGATYHDE